VTQLVTLTEVAPPQKARVIGEAVTIFWETANTTVFDSHSAKFAFYARWFGHYLDADPASFFLAVDVSGAVIGYLAGCLDSFSEAARIIIDDISLYTPAFCAAMSDYPSHFHINVKPGCQGRGIGALLVARFIQHCQKQRSRGIHVVTGAQSRAVDFYELCGFRRIPEADPEIAVLVYAIPAP